MTLADFLRAYMDRHGLNQSELAERFGFYPSAISRWLSGYPPALRTCKLIAEKLGEDTGFILKLAGYIGSDDDPTPDPIGPTPELRAAAREFLAVIGPMPPAQRRYVMTAVRSMGALAQASDDLPPDNIATGRRDNVGSEAHEPAIHTDPDEITQHYLRIMALVLDDNSPRPMQREYASTRAA